MYIYFIKKRRVEIEEKNQLSMCGFKNKLVENEYIFSSLMKLLYNIIK